MKFLIVHIISLCLIVKCSESITSRFSSSCLVDPCDSNNQGGSCSTSNVCYRFETSRNTTLCAPQITCSLFDPCSSSKTCSSNATVCVLNSCCLVPVCMPVALASTCTSTNNNTVIPTASSTARPPQTTPPGNVCSDVMWNNIEETALQTYWINNSGFSFNDFALDSNNNYYIFDWNTRRILKIPANNTRSYTVIGITNASLAYNVQNIFVDANNVVYTVENRNVYDPYTYINTIYNRLVSYVEGNGTNGTVLFGEVTCGNGTNQICGCGNLFVDNQGFMYCSDSQNHRVVKIAPFSTTVTVVAGVTGVMGWANNQLCNPGGIVVDSNNTLYVVDRCNFRIIMFTSGNMFGTVLFASGTSHSPLQLTLDKTGNILFSTYSEIWRLNLGSKVSKSVIQLSNYGGSKLQLDTFGNIYCFSNTWYTTMYMPLGFSIINRYNIIPSTC